MFKKSNLCLLITAVLFLSVQIIAVVIYIYSFIPYPAVWSDPFLKGVEPERETFFYLVFLATSMVLMVLSVKWVLPQLGSIENRRKLKLWLGMEFVWCFLMVFCFFKWSTYRYPFWNVLPYENSTWLQPFFCTVSGLALLSKIFFPEIEIFYKRWQNFANKKQEPSWCSLGAQILFILGVIALIYIPKPQQVTALGLSWGQWNHLDRVTGWFIKQGWFVNYEQTIQILVWMAIVYIIGLFYFIRLWLGSWLLAATGALLAIKMGMFYYGCAPCVWINPANSFLAHGWDIFLFFGLWYLSVKHPKKFYPAAILAGAILVWAWFKSNGYIDALGYDNQPLMAPLRVRQFFPFFMGYLVPVFYVFSLLVLMNQKTTPSRSLVVIIGIYGLMIFVEYLEHPMIGFYGSLLVPAILIVLWWLKEGFSLSTLFVQRSAGVIILLLSLGSLMTNRLMMTYPNVIFQDKQRFLREETDLEHFDAITKSASLISRLTQEEQKVALLSNFETALLMQAHRQPLFDDFPVMFSSINDTPGGLNLKTKKQGLKLIDELAYENALYVFVDARLLALSPQALANTGLNAVLDYLKNHYQIYTRQGFLVALQRR